MRGGALSSPRMDSVAVAVLFAAGLSSAAALAQPGTPLADSAVGTDIKTLFALAGQVYPAFASGSGYY